MKDRISTVPHVLSAETAACDGEVFPFSDESRALTVNTTQRLPRGVQARVRQIDYMHRDRTESFQS